MNLIFPLVFLLLLFAFHIIEGSDISLRDQKLLSLIFYLAEAVMTEQEKKCEGCCYAKGQPCVSVTCYKDLEAWLRAKRARKEGGADE